MSDRYSFGKAFGIGCGDNSCAFGPTGGMGTNGGCRCFGRGGDAAAREYRLKVGSGLHLLRRVAELPDVALALEEIAARLRREAEGKCRTCGRDANHGYCEP